jgi:inner membrane protein
MDSVTQIALGAAVGEAVLGKQIGRKAMLWGGIYGLFPDLDVLIPLGDAVKAVTYHRGPSHSLFVLAALTPVFVWMIIKLHPQTSSYRNRWYILVYLAFATHVILDCFTVYGTQALWPLGIPPVMWSTIFIIDPAYSVPLLTGVLAALVLSRRRRWGNRFNTACLMLSSIYLMWSAGAKLYVTGMARDSLHRQGLAYHRIMTVPAPFNTLLWRILVMEDNGYHEGFYSVFDGTTDIRFMHHASDSQLLDGLENHWPVKRLKWFTHGFYSVQRSLDNIVITDLRMGMEPNYFFRFKVGEIGNPHGKPTESKRVSIGNRTWNQLRWVWERIWSPEAELA